MRWKGASDPLKRQMFTDVRPPSPSGPEVFAVAAPYGAALQFFRDVDWLDEHEQDRMRRYVRPVDRDRYRAAHMLVRAVLAARLGSHPQDIQFTVQEFGKPVLKNVEDLDFNLSHGGNWVAVIFGQGVKVGVDVEENRPIEVWREVLPAIEAMDDFVHVPHQRFSPDRCLRLWTAKEAVLKCVGTGFGFPPDQLPISRSEGAFLGGYENETIPGCWVDLDSGHKMALAYAQASAPRVHICRNTDMLRSCFMDMPLAASLSGAVEMA